MKKDYPQKRVAIEEAYWMMHINNLDDCLSCPLSGCWADEDNDYTEKHCPIYIKKEKNGGRVTRKEKNRLQGIKYRKARIPFLKKIDKAAQQHGPLSVSEANYYSGVKKITLWEWGRLGLFHTVPVPKNYIGDRKAHYLIKGVNWESENQKH